MKIFFRILSLIVCLMLMGCHSETSVENNTLTITDSTGRTASLNKNSRVVSCYGSFAECWLLSGGALVGVTADAVEERKLKLDENVEIIGTVKDINLEKLAELSPDYVILSDDLSAHKKMRESLDNMGIEYGFFRADSFDDYDFMMQQFCRINEHYELYEKNVSNVKKHIEDIMKKIPSQSRKSFVVMRAYSSGVKVKTDNFAYKILKEFNLKCLLDDIPSSLEELSIEKIIETNPDYIFVLTMGDEKKASEYLKSNAENNPAWSELKAVKNNNYIILPKNLFHYKPNHRWGESYEYMAKIIYPEIFK